MKILLSGATGRIGRTLEALADADPGVTVTARASREAFFAPDDDGDVVVDFSRPEACAAAACWAAERGLPFVSGTTGLDSTASEALDAAARCVAVCHAANFSVGVNLLVELVQRAASALDRGFDIEISELHHRWKEDAPSGTALALGRAAARGRGQPEPSAHASTRRGAREPGEIGYQSLRGGDAAGEHTVCFLGDGERIELVHRAGDRTVFARGALRAARWVIGRPPGRYGMAHVLAAE